MEASFLPAARLSSHANADIQSCVKRDSQISKVALCPQKGALSTAEVCEALGLSQLKGRKWHVQRAVAIRGEGLYEGLDW